MDATSHDAPAVRDVALALQTAGLERVPLDVLERAAIANALEKCGHNRTHAAETLGISVRTLQRKIKAGFIDGCEPNGCEFNGEGDGAERFASDGEGYGHGKHFGF
jgi:DNA-binding NtrC family response regulator